MFNKRILCWGIERDDSVLPSISRRDTFSSSYFTFIAAIRKQLTEPVSIFLFLCLYRAWPADWFTWKSYCSIPQSVEKLLLYFFSIATAPSKTRYFSSTTWEHQRHHRFPRKQQQHSPHQDVCNGYAYIYCILWITYNDSQIVFLGLLGDWLWWHRYRRKVRTWKQFQESKMSNRFWNGQFR